MSADADQKLKAREELLRHMSHEIRTPLNGVIGMLGLLARTKMDGAQRAYVANARESAEHLLGLVNDLLDFARIEAGKLELETAPVDVERVVQGVAELLSPKAHEKGLDLAWSVAGDVPATLLADEGRLRQILFNLAGNAVKFTESGGVLIAVTREGGRGKTCKVRFSVRDTGPGVPAEARDVIFEEFGHADPSHAGRYGGAGLGLAVVKRLVDAMDGRVGLASAVGEGSDFWFEAPFRSADAEPREQALEGLAVAIASPSFPVGEAAARQVGACGGTAVVADTIEAAARAASHDAVVLIDHALAGEAPLAPRPKGRKALILLKPEERELIEKYRSAGYAGYLIKPLRRASLATRVLAVLNGASAAPGAPVTDDERVAPAAVAGVRVLLAEDNPVNALLVTTLLRREGCTVETAGDGREALQALSRARYDLVFMDMRMPGLDGPAATRAMRARGDQTPVVALTANAFEQDRRACLEAGMNDFLTKPLEPAALRTALARWTNRDWRVKLAS